MEIDDRHPNVQGETIPSMGQSSSTSTETPNHCSVIRHTRDETDIETNPEYEYELGRRHTSGPARGNVRGCDDLAGNLCCGTEFSVFTVQTNGGRDFKVGWDRHSRPTNEYIYCDLIRNLTLHEHMAEWVTLIIKLKQFSEPNPENITAYFKILELLPFGEQDCIFSFELNDKGVPHCHILLKTTRRGDKVREIILKHLGEPNVDCIRASKVKNWKGMMKYILKNTLAVGATNQWLLDASVYYSTLDRWTFQTQSNPGMNEMCKDIVDSMIAHNITTSEELYAKCPNIMAKYIHRSNLEGIIQNCRNFIQRPTGFQRIALLANEKPIIAANKIHNYLIFQNCNTEEFDHAFKEIFITRTGKKNVLCLKGISNSGKSCFIRGLTELFSTGNVVNGGNFQFSHCIGKELLLWEEPLITSEISETCKVIFEGYPTSVAIKYKDARTLDRTPILITTNRDIWHYCSHNKEALKNRIFEFNFNSSADNLDSHYRASLVKYSEFVSEYFKSTTNGSEYSQPICSSIKWCHCRGCFSNFKCFR